MSEYYDELFLEAVKEIPNKDEYNFMVILKTAATTSLRPVQEYLASLKELEVNIALSCNKNLCKDIRSNL